MLPVLRRNTWPTLFSDDPFVRLRNEMDTLFDRFFGQDGGSVTSAWSGIPIALWEDDDHYFVEADLPGVSDADVEVTVHNGMLFIRGERRPPEGRDYVFNNRLYGRFERVIALPASVDPDNVKAELNGGVLTVELSKRPESKPKRIALQKHA
ncbi:MAG: Hsp20/alpha crystallin family protein [Isosphaeraceae bacterium]|nr:Hsp20/alpha crystallin family protein [Isosphaeraceae bacterium]